MYLTKNKKLITKNFLINLQKNKKGFTLIELMVVVAIIGILALLGLRLYTGQQEKAKEAIVKANAGTVQTLIQAELSSASASDVNDDLSDIFSKSGIYNPFDNTPQETNTESAAEGEVHVSLGTVLNEGTEDDDVFFINGYGAGADSDDENWVYDQDLTARR